MDIFNAIYCLFVFVVYVLVGASYIHDMRTHVQMDSQHLNPETNKTYMLLFALVTVWAVFYWIVIRVCILAPVLYYFGWV